MNSDKLPDNSDKLSDTSDIVPDNSDELRYSIPRRGKPDGDADRAAQYPFTSDVGLDVSVSVSVLMFSSYRRHCKCKWQMLYDLVYNKLRFYEALYVQTFF